MDSKNTRDKEKESSNGALVIPQGNGLFSIVPRVVKTQLSDKDHDAIVSGQNFLKLRWGMKTVKI